MQILIIVATKLEIIPFLKKCNYHASGEESLTNLKIGKNILDIAIAGIGLIATTYTTTKILCKKKYDLIINTGIAGSFNRDFKIGEVVEVAEEQFSDLGIEHPDKFETLFDAGFSDQNQYPFENGKLLNEKSYNLKLKKVRGISSNTAHGNKSSIEKLEKKFNADIETMEGAAFFYVCLQEKIPFIQIRAISNYVEPRNKENWNIPLALENLADVLLEFLKSNS